jgi:membrane protein
VSAIPARGWRDILLRVKSEIAADNLALVAAGVSFYLLLAIVPGLAAAISLYGLIADPAQIQAQFSGLATMLPAEVYETVTREMQRIASSNKIAGFGAALGILVALWSGSRGMNALIQAMNIVYEENERRGYFKVQALALAFTLGAIIVVAVAVLVIAAAPGLLQMLGLSAVATYAVAIGRWILLIAVAFFGLSVLYRFGPSRERPKWRWASWGAVVATVGWLLTSFLFSFYLSSFGNYNKTYGSLGAVAVLLMWLYLSSFVVLVGGELNAETEHQTAQDTTTGPPEPMGERGAQMADSVGRSP